MHSIINLCKSGFTDLFHLFYPKLCLACNYHEPTRNEWFCISCRYKIPKTDHHLHKENDFTKRFWGRVKVESAAALFLYIKSSYTQNVIHNLKYEGRYQIGKILGEQMGKNLKEAPHFQHIDLIVPVPLHWKKLRIRGYNQSEVFAQGIAKPLNIPVIPNGLKREKHSTSQTKKGKIDRLENVETVFKVGNIKALAGKHILLVDDVLTSGATLEACANTLLSVPNTKVSMATIAIRPQ